MTREEHIYQLKQYLQGKSISMCPASSLYWQEHWEEVIKALEQEPTTKNNLGVEKTDMIDKSNFSQEQYKADLQSAYDCGYEQAKNDLGVDCIDRNSIKYYPGTGGYMYASKGEIDKLPSVTPQEPRWIPVSEYLPVTNDEVLVTYIVNGNAKKRYVETANCFDGEWSSVNDEYRIPNTKIEIIAWCEMPKPYKAEVESQESEGT